MSLLAIHGLTKRFGGLVALRDLDLAVGERSIHSVIGPNGAGKTTLFNRISGFYRPDAGAIRLGGERVDGLLPNQIARRGVARTYQNIRLFPNMTILDNVLIGRHLHLRSSWVQAVLGAAATRREEQAARREAERLLDFVGISGREGILAKHLAYGEQRRVEVARALACRPRLLLLDEPTAGMSAAESLEMVQLIRRLRDELGITVLLIEHQMRVVMRISDAISVLDYGVKISEGTLSAVQHDPQVVEAYLGTSAAVPGATPADRSRAAPHPGRGGSLLEVEDLHVAYGEILALRGVSLQVAAGEIVTLIGANGAGKTTTLKTISGLVRPQRGRVRLEGAELTGCPPHAVVERGVVQVPEGRRIFGRLTVAENLAMGGFTRRSRQEAAQDLAWILRMLPRLQERIGQVAGTLSGGEQQMLAIGRALMGRPRVLLLDEPSMGLAPLLAEQIFQIIREINARGTTMLLVEQNAAAALSVAHRGYVLETGEVQLSGPAGILQEHSGVRRAYLGEGA